MFFKLSSRPLVTTTGVKEWPAPATRMGRFRLEASCTSAASSSSELGSAFCRAMKDLLPTQLRQCPPGPSCAADICVTSVMSSFPRRLVSLLGYAHPSRVYQRHRTPKGSGDSPKRYQGCAALKRICMLKFQEDA